MSGLVEASNLDFLRKVVAPVVVPIQDRINNNNNSNGGKTIRKLTPAELKKEREIQKKRRKERRARAQASGKTFAWQQPEQSVSSSSSDNSLQQSPRFDGAGRQLGWMSSSSSGGAYSESYLADPSQEYDKWAQAYRFLGGYIDCDYDWDNDRHNSHDNQNNNNDGVSACSRWMIYATYINPNYEGNGYEEYFDESGNRRENLNCHLPDSQWQLLGVYRQEHYQYIEQISKHLWAITAEEYVVALAGLAYMTKYQCYVVGNDNNGDYLYVAVKPVSQGDTTVALYTDNQCLIEDTSGLNPDDFVEQNEVYLGSKDQENSLYFAYDWWYSAQEYTLTDMNTVYEKFKFCTNCVDYPTYQDGYFIGDYGTDDDDVINQCWKFWSHDAYVCESDCLAKANAQGTILQIDYAGRSYGYSDSSFYQQSYNAMASSSASSTTTSSSSKATHSDLESPLARLLANAFLTLTFLLFVATFLAFAVARRSRYRESRSSRSRRLLDDDHQSRRSASRSRRSKSRDTRSGGDGLFRDDKSSSRRSKSRSSRSRAGGSSRRAAS
ncbi:hypothetical protein ACA910_001045 [Epithemia clementina (nom. ined.)]